MYTDENGICYPSMSTIAKSRGMTRQAVQKHVQELEKAGYITRKERFLRGSQQSNLLQVKFDFDPTPATSEVAQNDRNLTTPINDKAEKKARPYSEKRKKYLLPYNLMMAPEIAKLCSLSLQNGSRSLCFDAADFLRKGINPPKTPFDLHPFFAKGGKIYFEWPWNSGERLKPMDIVKHWPRLSGAIKPPTVKPERNYEKREEI